MQVNEQKNCGKSERKNVQIKQRKNPVQYKKRKPCIAGGGNGGGLIALMTRPFSQDKSHWAMLQKH